MVAMRPVSRYDDNIKFFDCPKCKRAILSTKDYRQQGQKEKYCRECGQKIDWSHEVIETYWTQ